MRSGVVYSFNLVEIQMRRIDIYERPENDGSIIVSACSAYPMTLAPAAHRSFSPRQDRRLVYKLISLKQLLYKRLDTRFVLNKKVGRTSSSASLSDFRLNVKRSPKDSYSLQGAGRYRLKLGSPLNFFISSLKRERERDRKKKE